MHRHPLSQRLRGHKAFSRLFAEGDLVRAGSLRGFYKLQQSSTGGIATGFAISRSVKRATARNRIKRVLREAWRESAPDMEELCLKNRTMMELVILYAGGDNRGRQSTAALVANVKQLAERLRDRIQEKS